MSHRVPDEKPLAVQRAAQRLYGYAVRDGVTSTREGRTPREVREVCEERAMWVLEAAFPPVKESVADRLLAHGERGLVLIGFIEAWRAAEDPSGPPLSSGKAAEALGLPVGMVEALAAELEELLGAGHPRVLLAALGAHDAQALHTIPAPEAQPRRKR